MKIVYIEIEADEKELKSTRTLSENFINALERVANKISPQIEEEDEYEEEEDE